MDASLHFPQLVRIPLGRALLHADLHVPEVAIGLVVFAHGSGSSRRSVRNQFVADELGRRGFATLLPELLTSDEALADEITSCLLYTSPSPRD